MMIREALQYVGALAEKAAAVQRQIGMLRDGRAIFTDTGETIGPPSPKAISFSTLAGLAKFLNEYSPDGKPAIHVVSPGIVHMIGTMAPIDMVRHCWATATAEPTRHSFGQYHDAETFMIWILSGFVQDETVASVLRVVGNLKAEKVSQLADDGVTQVASVRAGVARSTEVEIKNPIWLAPYRTFSEVEQPASPFILRLHEQQGGAPKVALFESQDVTWKAQAMAWIGDKLREMIDEKTIPIFA